MSSSASSANNSDVRFMANAADIRLTILSELNDLSEMFTEYGESTSITCVLCSLAIIFYDH